jgi:hypothetical protein
MPTRPGGGCGEAVLVIPGAAGAVMRSSCASPGGSGVYGDPIQDPGPGLILDPIQPNLGPLILPEPEPEFDPCSHIIDGPCGGPISEAELRRGMYTSSGTMPAGELVKTGTSHGIDKEYIGELDKRLTDEDLLNWLNKPNDGDFVLMTRGGTIVGGHHRVYLLEQRIKAGRIDPNTQIRFDYTDERYR